jgi:integrase
VVTKNFKENAMSGSDFRLRLSKKSIDGLKPTERRAIFWDNELPGFGLRIEETGRKTFIVRYRPGGGRKAPKRFLTLGRYGNLTTEEARVAARKVLSAGNLGMDPAADRLRKRQELTVAELCDLYLEIGVEHKKALTIYGDRGRIDRHIKPLLGTKRVGDVTLADVERAMKDIAEGKTRTDVRTGKIRARIMVRGGKGAATRIIGLLGGIFTFAQRHGYRTDNPCRGVRRYKGHACERFLNADDLAKLGAVLAKAEEEGANSTAINIFRMLAMTGARRGEISALLWDEVDFDHACLRLRDSKTGAKVIPLGGPALHLLRNLIRLRQSPFVFPATVGRGHFIGVKSTWDRIRREAGFPDLRIHDLRHSFASMGLAAGDTLPMIGALLGHSNPRTTARYAHLADDPKRQAAHRISGRIANAMGLSSIAE